MITIETRKNNLVLMKALEETDQNLVKELTESELLKEMNQEEISFMIQDSLMGSFVDQYNQPFKLRNTTIRLLMLYKINLLQKG